LYSEKNSEPESGKAQWTLCISGLDDGNVSRPFSTDILGYIFQHAAAIRLVNNKENLKVVSMLSSKG
jgi:hypothetical protein